MAGAGSVAAEMSKRHERSSRQRQRGKSVAPPQWFWIESLDAHDATEVEAACRRASARADYRVEHAYHDLRPYGGPGRGVDWRIIAEPREGFDEQKFARALAAELKGGVESFGEWHGIEQSWPSRYRARVYAERS